MAAWEARLAGDTEDAEIQFAAAKRLAQLRNFNFLPAAQVAQLPTNELSVRIDTATNAKGELDKVEAAAILGGAKPPDINLTQSLELFWSLAAEITLGKNSDQIRRWRNPYKKAISNFVAVVGDKSICKISRDDMLVFRQWWFDRMKEHNLTANSANKDLIHMGKVLKTVNEMKNLGYDLPLSGLSFKEGEAEQRPPFSDIWIKDKILANGALDFLNSEARCILLGMINTGYRPSEAQGLMPEHIKLEGTIPHICIEPIGRQLKSPRSRRRIPLVGLVWMRLNYIPRVFPDIGISPVYRRQSISFYAKISYSKRPNIHFMACDIHLKIGCSPEVLMKEYEGI